MLNTIKHKRNIILLVIICVLFILVLSLSIKLIGLSKKYNELNNAYIFANYSAKEFIFLWGLTCQDYNSLANYNNYYAPKKVELLNCESIFNTTLESIKILSNVSREIE